MSFRKVFQPSVDEKILRKNDKQRKAYIEKLASQDGGMKKLNDAYDKLSTQRSHILMDRNSSRIRAAKTLESIGSVDYDHAVSWLDEEQKKGSLYDHFKKYNFSLTDEKNEELLGDMKAIDKATAKEKQLTEAINSVHHAISQSNISHTDLTVKNRL